MDKQLHNTLTAMRRDQRLSLLAGGSIGLEKECLRVDVHGKLSQQPHPKSLGSALTNPFITTDFSEALLEFITPPEKSVPASLDWLKKIHQFVFSELGDESIWGASMPCIVAGEDGIPIAQYGSSNSGMMKTVYRRGLGHRYGKMMQAIAGVHFNYSVQEEFWPYYRALLKQDNVPLTDFVSEHYFNLIRNLKRFGWLVFYLFGASPAICKSFLSGQPGKLEKFDENTYYLPYATSLRMGDIGYTNKKENETGVQACYDNLPSYVNCLTKAIETPCPEYEKIGVKVDEEYRQLNANILQIENEYYSTIRPKQPLVKNEKPVRALAKRGVQYIELRSLDLNLYEPMGVGETQLYFLEALMLFCLLKESPEISKAEREMMDDNDSMVAHQGRNPLLTLRNDGKEVPLQSWGRELLEEMQPICEILDEQNETSAYSQALNSQKAAIEDASLTPSARVIQDMKNDKECFFVLANKLSRQHEKTLRNSTLSEKEIEYFQYHVRQSVEKQRQIELKRVGVVGLFLMGMAVLSNAAHAEIFKWVDENGKVHYSDRKISPQAETVNVKTGADVPTKQTNNPDDVDLQGNPYNPNDPEFQDYQDSLSAEQRLVEQQKYVNFLQSERLDRAEKRMEAKQKEDKQRKLCATMRDQLKGYTESNYRWYELDEAGERQFLSDDQINAKQQSLIADIKSNCS